MTDPIKPLLTILRAILFQLLVAATLTACSGGISGTGDGGPIIVVDGDTTDAGANSTDSNIPDATVDMVVANQILPGNLLSQTRIDTTAPASDGVAVESSVVDNAIVTNLLNTLLSQYNEAGSNVSTDITLLEPPLLEALNTCESQGRCSTLPSTASPPSTAAEVTQSYSNIVFAQGTSGIFDKEFSYTREDGAQVTLQWNNQEDLLYFFIDTTNATTYSYTDKQQNTVTLRHINKASSSVLQATIVTNSDSSITVEADLVEWYLRGTLTPQTTLIYAVNQQSPTNRREATTPDGSTVVTETCDRSNCLWQSEFSNSATEVFGNTESSLGDFSQTINNQQGITLPSSPDRLVISTSDDNGSPALQSVSCGSVRVLDRRRTFCWQTFPAADERFVYKEIYNSGITGYRQVATAP